MKKLRKTITRKLENNKGKTIINLQGGSTYLFILMVMYKPNIMLYSSIHVLPKTKN